MEIIRLFQRRIDEQLVLGHNMGGMRTYCLGNRREERALRIYFFRYFGLPDPRGGRNRRNHC